MDRWLNCLEQNGGGGVIRWLDDDSVRIDLPDLADYKFFCFNGKVKFFKIDFDRFSNHGANYYTPEGVLMDFYEVDYPSNLNTVIVMTQNLDKMLIIYDRLSKALPFVRYDYYNQYDM